MPNMKTQIVPALSGSSRRASVEKLMLQGATADYYPAQQRIRDRTQELRRLRLAREAQEKARAG